MNIGQLSATTGVPAATVRYYERRGLLEPPRRTRAGYRQYEAETTQRLRFIKRAQELGFTLEEIADLLAFWQDSATSCGKVEGRATATLERIDTKIRDLKRMRSGLSQYVNACRTRDALSACPLLASLACVEETEK